MYNVYVRTVKSTGKKYVGVTKNTLKQRMGKDGEGYRGSPYFYAAICKYGVGDIESETIAKVATLSEASAIEKDLIIKYDTMNPEHGYNLHRGGYMESYDPDAEGSRVERIRNTLVSQRSGAEYRKIMSERMSKVWNDPIRRADIIRKRSGKFAGRPRLRYYCKETEKLYECQAMLSKDLGVSDTAIRAARTKSNNPDDWFTVRKKDTDQYGKKIYTTYTLKIVHTKESELLGHPNEKDEGNQQPRLQNT